MSDRQAFLRIGLITVALVVLALVWVSSKGPAAPAGSSGVQWQDYAPEVRTRIDGFARERDCAALQGEFDIADANNEATLARTGHNNARLMDYIDDKLRRAGCY